MDKSRLLIKAADEGDVAAVKKLLSSPFLGLFQTVPISATDEYGETALMRAAARGHNEMVDLLLEAGADVNFRHEHGYTALHLAASNGHLQAVVALLAKGAEVNLARNSGVTALWEAAYHGHREIVNALIAHGADVNVQVRITGPTALWAAAIDGHKEIVTILLEHGAQDSMHDLAQPPHSAALLGMEAEIAARIDAIPWDDYGESSRWLPRALKALLFGTPDEAVYMGDAIADYLTDPQGTRMAPAAEAALPFVQLCLEHSGPEVCKAALEIVFSLANVSAPSTLDPFRPWVPRVRTVLLRQLPLVYSFRSERADPYVSELVDAIHDALTEDNGIWGERPDDGVGLERRAASESQAQRLVQHRLGAVRYSLIDGRYWQRDRSDWVHFLEIETDDGLVLHIHWDAFNVFGLTIREVSPADQNRGRPGGQDVSGAGRWAGLIGRRIDQIATYWADIAVTFDGGQQVFLVAAPYAWHTGSAPPGKDGVLVVFGDAETRALGIGPYASPRWAGQPA